MRIEYTQFCRGWGGRCFFVEVVPTINTVFVIDVVCVLVRSRKHICGIQLAMSFCAVGSGAV